MSEPTKWTVERPVNKLVFHVRDENGVLVSVCQWPDEEQNCKLIAAAPELLAACEKALKRYESEQLFGPDRNKLTAAIKKAKGEQRHDERKTDTWQRD
jgi:hypothetical protein